MDDLDGPAMPGYLAFDDDEGDQALVSTDSTSRQSSLSSSMIFPAAHGALAIASFATKFGFNVAQKSVQLGLAIPQTIISNVLPSQLAPVSDIILASLSFAEFSALTALQLAEGISSTGLDLASYSVTELDALIKSYQQLQPSLPSLDALRVFLVILRQQWEKITPHASDLPPGITTEPFRFFQVLRALSTWALIQQLTQHVEDRQLASYLVLVQPSSSESQKPSQLEFESQEDEDRPEIVKQKFKRYIDLCLSSYGGLGQILFSSNKSPPAELTEQCPVNDSSSRSQSPSRSPKCASTYETWDLLLGKHDRDLLRQHGELFEEGEVPETMNEEERNIVEELKGILPIALMAKDLGRQEGPDKTAGKKEDTQATELTDLMEQMDSVGVTNEKDDVNEWNLVVHPDEKEITDSVLELEISSEASIPNLEENSRSTLSESQPQNQSSDQRSEPPITSNCQPPRYFILIDKINQTVIVCFRGTFSLADLTTDLTCDYENFDPDSFWDTPCLELEDEVSTETEKQSNGEGNNPKKQTFKVHRGFLEVSKRLTGLPIAYHSTEQQPKQHKTTKFMRSIRNALNQKDENGNLIQTYNKIEFVGHSLGGGVGVMLSLILADPRTGLSTKRSGLPEGTSIRTYAICSPCTTSKGLTELSRKMVKTLINHNDFIPRLSLDHVLNLKTLIIWIDYFENNPDQLPELISSNQNNNNPNGIWKNVLQIYARLKMFQSQDTPPINDDQLVDSSKKTLLDDEVWLIEMRSLLESKISKDHQVDVLLPSGTVYWMIKDDLFIVPKNKTQDIFNRIKFDISMFKDHLIHQIKTDFVKHHPT
ncbi:hypothetical protein MJO29_015033 [Puccinia striiformis f. sp. tritici]|uniref:hypothetical protein n=1 Tax=Puccinia striiformis f. sp. tritici TaxID=168172 RepID=UPI00200839C4|nr:hypothetical protein Pst134EA_028102 [Puccinia striiformis f. sp. tritici]KAH9448805.1 hypothetical protein Pst134EA_028102 [Puccinia striiformis f. sp. tritici]KAI7937718.1 hypothetical protein MJO29_015033 [Puccinia striiformis f. sp. tritici]